MKTSKINFTAAILFLAILFTIINLNTAYGQSANMVGSSGNNIAAVYRTDLADPMDLKVYQNYPNPFSSSTTIKFETASFSNLKLAIYDSNESLVKAYLYDNIKPGLHEVRIDGTDFPAGEYTYRFISGNYSQSYKMNIIK